MTDNIKEFRNIINVKGTDKKENLIMVLKEAYRYQNYLTALIDEAKRYLAKRDFITTTKQKHNRNKANPDAQDEIVEVPSPYTVEFTPMNLVDFIAKAITEKEKLSEAIVFAKKSAEIDIDAAIALNKIKQGYISVLSAMANTKASEKKTRGTDYKINQIDGNQISYFYDIDETIVINYDRNDVKGLIKKLTKETDDVSMKLDAIQITTEVTYVPIWDIGDSLEDVVHS